MYFATVERKILVCIACPLPVLMCVFVCYVHGPGCLRSCMRTMETLCRCSTAAPSWSTGSRPIARSLPGRNTPKTSCRHCRATTAMLSQVCYTDTYRCTTFLFYLYWLFLHACTIKKGVVTLHQQF